MYQYIQVIFNETRNVRSGGNVVGVTNQTLYVSPGVQTITLDGALNYSPPFWRGQVQNTDPNNPLLITFTKTVVLFLLLASIMLQVSGCAHHPINQPLKKYDASVGYRFDNAPTNTSNTDEIFVIVALSGGGTRAAALSYGALQELAETEISFHGVKKSLLDEVDIVSSVSGGSFVGAYYALHGKPPWRDFERHFLYKDVTLGLGLQVLNPLNWPKLISPYYDRVDLAADYYDKIVFNHATYADLEKRNSRPFLLLNATDMSLMHRFEFTQDQFDLMSSDLSSVPIARAVAASSAFPILLSPVTFNNYGQTSNGFVPRSWMADALADRQNNPLAYGEASAFQSYLDSTNRPFIHLLDGGLSDNIGLRGPFYALSYSQRPWTLLSRLNNTIQHLVLITVNAHNGTRPNWDKSEKAPGIVDVFSTVADGPMESYSELTVQQVIDLADELTQAGQVAGNDNTNRATETRQSLHKIKVYHIEVNFQDVKDKNTRDTLLNIGTNYHIPRAKVDLLISTARDLIRSSEGLAELKANLSKP